MNNEHWTNIIFTTPTPVFISAKPTEQIQQNAINIANEIEKAILSIDITKVSAIITDNASVMKAAWKILEKKYPLIIFFGCLAHGINLLIGDIMKIEWAKTILEKAKKIVIFFHNHIIPTAILKKYQREKYGSNYKSLKLSVKTRWYSAAKCLDSVYKNQLALSLTFTEIFSNNSIEIDNEIKVYIYDENFWNELKSLLNLLEQLAIGISLFESDTPKLSEFYEWYDKILALECK